MDVYVKIRKRIILDFLGYLFECDNSEGGPRFIVSRRIDAGRYLHALVEYSYKEVDHDAECVVFVLPRTSLSTAMGKFLFLSSENEGRFNDYLEAVFNLDFDRYWVNGLLLGISKQDIVYAYIQSRKLGEDLSIDETLKKRIYRKTARQQQFLHQQLLNKAGYHDRLIIDSLKNGI